MQPQEKLRAIAELGMGEVQYPIPMSFEGNASISDLDQISVVHISGDDHCIWVADYDSALFLIHNGHHVVKDENIQQKREAYRNNPEFRQKYPFWYK